MSKSEMAVSLMKEGSSCSQAVLTVFADELGLKKTDAHKIMTAFGGGFGRKQLVCGALSGGVAALNMKYGSEESSDAQGKTLAYDKVNLFLSELEKKWGKTDCRSLLGYDFSDKDAAQKAKDENLSAKVCHNLVKDVVQYIESDFISENN